MTEDLRKLLDAYAAASALVGAVQYPEGLAQAKQYQANLRGMIESEVSNLLRIERAKTLSHVIDLLADLTKKL